MKQEMKQSKHEASIKSYVIGFILSLFLTLASFIPVFLYQSDPSTHETLLILVLILALVQLGVQLVFFLHLGQEEKPAWNAIFLFLTAGIIITVVVSSIWIMNHLNHNMTPTQMNSYTHDQSGF